MGPMIRAASLRGFEPLVRELGGDAASYAERFSIPVDALRSDDGLIPITRHDLMLDVAAAELDCPDLGLRLAASQDLSILGPLALAIESSSTVTEALQCASRYMFVHSPALSISVEPDPRGARGVVALTYRKDLVESSYSPQAIELGLGLFHRIASHLMGGSRGLRSIELPHQPLSPVLRYTDFFGVDVKFGGRAAAMRVDRQILDGAFTSANETIRQLALDHLARHYPDPTHLVSVKVRRAVAEGLGVSTPSLAHAARLFAMHPRTLQRRLAEEGWTFGEILDVVRRESAHRYITTTDLPFAQIADLVGFGEQSNLSHAVRRWYGQSPRALRVAHSVRI